VRAIILACALASVLGATVALGGVREGRDLPQAAGALRSASEAAGEIKSCLQGVQDELAGGPTPRSIQNAKAALRLCDLRTLERRLAAVSLPGAAPIASRVRRLAREDIVEASRVMRRMVLDARAAKAAMAVDLGGSAQLTAVVLSYRAFAAGDDRSRSLAAEAAALLRTD
jgi:hypothetical protein